MCQFVKVEKDIRQFIVNRNAIVYNKYSRAGGSYNQTRSPSGDHGIEKKEDELSTLYDILLDEEIPGGIRLFTETRRCYRLTKQAFINISHGLRLQSGVSPRQVVQQNWRRNDSSNQQPLSRPENQNVSTAANKLSELFYAARQSNAQSGNKMMAAPAKHEEPLSLRPQIIQGPAMAPSKNVDAEFKAMWNQLQNKLPISPPVPSQPPLSAVISPHAVSEQTNALKKALRISDGASSYPPAKNTEDLSLNWPVCDHLSGSCCKELSIQCQRMNVPFPQIEHVVDVTTEELSCVLHFSGGTDFMGPKCRSKPEALKRVSCLAVKDMLLGKNGKILSQVHGMMVPPRMPIPVMPHPPFPQGIMSMGRPAGPPANAGRRVIIPIMQENPSNVRGSHHIMPVQNLPPNPPQQWCQQGPVDSRNHKNLDNFQSQGNAPRKSTNPFVPLQAQTAAMMKGSVELKPKPAGAHQPPFPQGPRGERWTNNAAPSAFVPSKPSHSGTSSTTGETKSYQQGSAPSHRPRRKRIAANFSKPLDN